MASDTPSESTANQQAVYGLDPALIDDWFDDLEAFRDEHPWCTPTALPIQYRPVVCRNCTTGYAVTAFGADHSAFCGHECRRDWFTDHYDVDPATLTDHGVICSPDQGSKDIPDGVKRRVRDAANNRCQRCGVPREVIPVVSYKQNLDTHHATKFQRLPTLEVAAAPENLWAVCYVCHVELDTEINRLDDVYADLGETLWNTEAGRRNILHRWRDLPNPVTGIDAAETPRRMVGMATARELSQHGIPHSDE